MAGTTSDKFQMKATHHLKNSMKSSQVYLVYLIPSIIHCFIYVMNFSLDLVVAIQHLRENNPLWAGLTVFFMYAPALAHFILIISKPDWWMSDEEKLQKSAISWSFIQAGKCIAFPLLALYRYAGLIVLSVDAIILSGDQRKKTLDIAAAPISIELYFFLQAWFQAIPQSVFQTHLLLREPQTSKTAQSEIIQVSCILMSVCIIAMKSSSFQRYESQRINGRKVPWATWFKKSQIQEFRDFEEKQLLTSSSMAQQDLPKKNLKEPSLDLHHGNLEKQVSATPPLPPKNVKTVPPPTPLRGITSITRMTVPDLPAPPRPDSIEARNQNTQITKPPLSLNDEENNFLAFKKVQSKEIPFQTVFAENFGDDNPFGTVLSVLWWFSFILPRVLSIVIFFKFYPQFCAAILGAHYVFMICYLFYYTKYYDLSNLLINLWLGLIYIFSLIEYRIKFANADIWLIVYYIFITVQNALMTLCWYIFDNWNGLWYLYSFYAIFGGMGFCLLLSIVHYTVQPQRRRVYTT